MKRMRIICIILIAVFAICTSAIAESADWNTVGAKIVNVELKNTPLSAAIETLLKGQGINYTIDPALANADVNITALLKNVSLSLALTQILQGTGASYRVNGGNMISIMPMMQQQAANTANNAAMFRDSAGNMKLKADSITSQTIDLKYIPVETALELAQSLPNVAVTQSTRSKISLIGESGNVSKAEKMIKMADDISSMPRCVRVRLTTKISYKDASGKMQMPVYTTESVGYENTQMPLALSVGGTNRESSASSFIKDGVNINVLLTPTILGADNANAQAMKVSLAGSGNISASYYTGKLVGKVSRDFSKQFDFALPLDAPVVDAGNIERDYKRNSAIIAYGNSDINDLSDIGFAVYAQAWVLEGRVPMPSVSNNYRLDSNGNIINLNSFGGSSFGGSGFGSGYSSGGVSASPGAPAGSPAPPAAKPAEPEK